MKISKKLVVYGLATTLLSSAAVYAAALVTSATRPGNYTFAQGTANLVPLDGGGATQVTFTGSGKYAITYSAECAVSAPAGNTSTWLDLDIELVPDTAAPAVFTVLAPTAGSSDAFCTANGTAGADGWATQSITVPTEKLKSGVTHAVRIRAKVTNGAAGDSGWLGDSSIVVIK